MNSAAPRRAEESVPTGRPPCNKPGFENQVHPPPRCVGVSGQTEPWPAPRSVLSCIFGSGRYVGSGAATRPMLHAIRAGCASVSVEPKGTFRSQTFKDTKITRGWFRVSPHDSTRIATFHHLSHIRNTL